MNLKKLRAELNYKQEDVANIIGCSRQTYVALEKGRTGLSDRFIVILRKLFRCTTAELYGMDIFIHKPESKEEIEYIIKMLQDQLNPDNGETEYGLNLRKYRKERNLTVDELADLSGVTGAQIRNIESFRCTTPNAVTLFRLSNALNITYEELVGVK